MEGVFSNSVGGIDETVADIGLISTPAMLSIHLCMEGAGFNVQASAIRSSSITDLFYTMKPKICPVLSVDRG